MRIQIRWILVIVLLGGGLEPAVEASERTFEFTYIAALEKIPDDAERVSMWLPYPRDDDLQDVRIVSIDAPVKTQLFSEYIHRNSMLFITAKRSELVGDELRVAMTFRITRRENAKAGFAEHEEPDGYIEPVVRKWLKPDRLVPLDDYVREQAEEVTAGRTSVVDKARAIYDYTVDNLEYNKSGTGWGRGDIYYACDKKRGNCTDFHAVFIGFARAVGIPAKFQIGFPIPSDRGAGAVDGYHCWAEFYVPGYGWVPVDTSEANKNPDKRAYFFGAHDENRVEFTVGRDITLNPKQSGEPLNFFIYPYAEIDGQPATNVTREFRYRDLEVIAE